MKTLLGLPVKTAVERLEKERARYTIVTTCEPKRSLHGTDARVVRVRQTDAGLELVVSDFVTEPNE